MTRPPSSAGLGLARSEASSEKLRILEECYLLSIFIGYKCHDDGRTFGESFDLGQGEVLRGMGGSSSVRKRAVERILKSACHSSLNILSVEVNSSCQDGAPMGMAGWPGWRPPVIGGRWPWQWRLVLGNSSCLAKIAL